MSAFWVVVAVLAILAAACVLVPLWLHRPQAGLSREEINTCVFRDRLSDLDAELEERKIDAAQYQAMRAELERTLLDDVPREDTRHRQSGGLRLAATAAAASAPLLAIGYYYTSSYRGEAAEWMALQSRFSAAVERAVHDPGKLPQEALAALPDFTRALQAMVLREGMDDPDSLFLLGIGLVQLQRPEQALAVLDRALQLAPQRTDVMLGYAQASLLANDGKLDHASAQLLHAVLQREPDHPRALMMLGFGASNAGDYEAALRAWRALLANLEPDGETARLLRENVARAERALTVASGDGESAADTGAADAGKASIAVSVEVASELESRVGPEDVLFVFAKAVNGPPMPLAAVRQRAQGFPVQVVLDDGQAMIASMKLSDFRDVVVGARISRTGGAVAKPGDLEGLSETLSLADGPLPVALTIDRIVQ